MEQPLSSAIIDTHRRLAGAPVEIPVAVQVEIAAT